jgi:hypothetical protein
MGSVEHSVPRVVLIVVFFCAASGCGGSGSGADGDSLAPIGSSAETTLTPTTLGAADHPATTEIANTVGSTLVVSEGGVVLGDVLPPGAWIGARTSDDGRSLVLFFVGAAEYEPDQPCTMRYLPVVEETETEVHVAMRGERPSTANGTIACTLEGYSRSVNVDFSNPVGDRTLVALGQPRGVFDGSTLARPQWIPEGWEQNSEFPGQLDEAGTTWMRSWTPTVASGEGTCPLGESGLVLLEGTSGVVDRSIPPAEETGTHDINGATATSSTQSNRNITRLAWTIDNRSYLLSSAPACNGDQPPSLDIMLQFARSLDTSVQ